MADRDSKLNKAREQLDKFRKKKKMQEDPENPSSSTSSPIMFSARSSSEADTSEQGMQVSKHEGNTV